MRSALLALVATLLLFGPRAQAQSSAPEPPPPLRTGLREAFRLELKRAVWTGHAEGAGPTIMHGLLAGVMTKVSLTVPALAPGIALTTLPIVTPTVSRFGWRNGDLAQPRRFLGGLFRLTTRLGVGITIGSFALVNAAWNTFDWLRGRPTMSMIDRFKMRERAGEAPPTEPSPALSRPLALSPKAAKARPQRPRARATTGSRGRR